MAIVKPTYSDTGGTVTKSVIPPKVVAPPPTTSPIKNPTVINTASPEIIGDKTMAEIQRKAYAGEQMLSPTEAKMKAYNNFLAQKQKEDLTASAGANRDAFVENQGALLGQARDQQLADIQKQLADAVTEGTISVRDAQAQFEEQKAQINQQAYQDSQITNLTAEGRGIGNSQQLLGLMAGDNSRKNTMINQNMTTRDRRINDITDRINNIKNKGNIDITQANANYGYGMASAKAQADMQYNQNMYGMQLNDYEAGRDQQYTQDNMRTQQGYTQDNMNLANQFDLNKLSVQQKYTLQAMATQQGYDLNKMSKQQQYQLAQMATQYGYNMNMQNDAQSHDSAMLDKKNAFDMSAMATQHGFQMSEIGARSQAELKSIGARAQAEADAVEKEYQTAMGRELKKYTPGTQEYLIAQKQLESEKNRALTEIHTKAQAQAGAEFAKGLEKEVPTPPKSGLFGVSEKAQREYDNKLKSYYRYLDWQDDGQFNNSSKTGLTGNTYFK